MEGKAVRSDDPRIDRLIPAHIGCECYWAEVGDREVGKLDWLDFEDEEFVELRDSHAHFAKEPDKYEALRVPASPSGRDFVFRRGKAGEKGTREWKRPRYEERDDLIETGVTERGERWRSLPEIRPLDRPAGGTGAGGPYRSTWEPPARHESVEAAEVWAGAQGVEADYGDRLHVANAFSEVIGRARNNGFSIPKGIRFDASMFADDSDPIGTPTRYDERTGVVFLNPAHPMWSSAQSMAVWAHDQRASGYWSSDDPVGSLLHEVVHHAHVIGLPEERLIELRGLRRDPRTGEMAYSERLLWTSEMRDEVRSEVSEYAGEGPLEFVAEMASAMLSDPPRGFSDRLRALYYFYGGPAK